MLPATPSSWNKRITPENPLNRYKFTSIEINASMDQNFITRETYSLLDYLGDLGGLFDALTILGQILISPVSGFGLSSQLLTTIFRVAKPSERGEGFDERKDKYKSDKGEKADIIDIKDAFRNSSIERKNYCFLNWVPTFCFKSKYKRLIEKSQNQLTKELDLRKFVLS